MENKQMPEIRFAEFSGEWEQRKLSELMDFSNGINAPKESYGKGRKMISVMDILDQNPIRYENIRNSVEVKKEIEDKNRVEKGDLVFVRSSEVVEEVGWAKAYLEDKYALYSGFTIRGKKKNEYDARFIELNLNSSSRKQIQRKSGGSTRFNASQSILKSIVIREPSIEEQMKIGEFLQQLDGIIVICEEELTTLKQAKQGFLQKMFPKEGESIPEIRLPGFTEDWEQCKIVELFKVTRGKVLAEKETSENQTVQMPYPVYSSQTKNNGLLGYYKDYLFDTAITWTTDGANAGTVNYRGGKFYSTNVNGVLLSNEGYANKAVAEALNMVAWKYVSRVGNPKLMNNTMSDIVISLPMTIEEQNQISNFFKQLDDTIALHEQELETLKQTKKAFLEKMFI